MHLLDSAEGAEGDEIVKKLFNFQDNYINQQTDDPIDYEFFPTKNSDGNNSNSYISGLLRTALYQKPEIEANVPGYNKPVGFTRFLDYLTPAILRPA